MPDYRAYIVGRDDHFIGFELRLCASDSEATEKATGMIDGHDVELRQGGCLVVLLRHEVLSKEIRGVKWACQSS